MKPVKREGHYLYQSDYMSARLVPAQSGRVIVSFPDHVHPTKLDGIGWGEGFFARREMTAVYINTASVDWFQSPDFFVAMAAIRNALGVERPITTYGSAMGGYGALLGAKALAADLCLAISPQYHIAPETTPFETRYKDHAARIGPFIHDLAAQVSDQCRYHVAYDPTHKIDAKHVALIGRHYALTRLPTYGAGRGVLAFWIDTRCTDTLSRFLHGDLDAQRFRQELRAKRTMSPRYFQRMANLRAASGRSGLVDYADLAAGSGFEKAARRITKNSLRRQPKLRRLLIHAGLPKTGTSALQAHFYHGAEYYATRGLWYPTQGISRPDLNHDWISQNLRDENTAQLRRTLAAAPHNCDAALLSDESLYVDLPGFSPAGRQALTNAVTGWNVELVLFQRDMREWRRSFYIQSIKNRRGGAPSERPSARDLWQTKLTGSQFFDLPFVRRLLDFDTMAADLSMMLAARETHILQYVKGHDTIDTLCAAIGLDRAPSSEARRYNLSLSDTDAEILRQANGMSNQDARLIRGLIEDRFGLAAGRLHKRRATRAAEIATDFDWSRFAYAPNPPLALHETHFHTRVAELRDLAGKLLSQLRLLT